MFYLVLSKEGSWKDNCEEKFFRNLLSICLVIRNDFVCGVGRVAIASLLLLLLPTILGHSACRIFPLLSYFCQKKERLLDFFSLKPNTLFQPQVDVIVNFCHLLQPDLNTSTLWKKSRIFCQCFFKAFLGIQSSIPFLSHVYNSNGSVVDVRTYLPPYHAILTKNSYIFQIISLELMYEMRAWSH